MADTLLTNEKKWVQSSRRGSVASTEGGSVVPVVELVYTEQSDDFFGGDPETMKVVLWDRKREKINSFTINEDIVPSELVQTFKNMQKAMVTDVKDMKYGIDVDDNIGAGASSSDIDSAIITNEDIEFFNKFAAQFDSQMASSKRAGLSSLDDFAKRYMFKKHILVKGDKGVGKTYTIDKMCKENSLNTIFFAGHEGVESVDLIGYYSKDQSGNLVWLDGVLTETFRKAKTGKTVLFIDEMLRMPARELNVFVGSLSVDSDMNYKLRTNRVIDIVDGIGVTECIEVPFDNLWVVATTNVGSKYNVDEIDDALSDRFRIFSKDMSNDEIELIFDNVIKERFGSSNLGLKMQLIAFFNKVQDLKKANELESSFNIRHITEAIKFSDNEKDIKQRIFDLVPNIVSVDMDGKMNKAEVELLTKLIKGL